MTKIGTEVAHVTRDSNTTVKVKRSKVNLQGAYFGGLPHSLFQWFKQDQILMTKTKTTGSKQRHGGFNF